VLRRSALEGAGRQAAAMKQTSRKVGRTPPRQVEPATLRIRIRATNHLACRRPCGARRAKSAAPSPPPANPRCWSDPRGSSCLFLLYIVPCKRMLAFCELIVNLAGANSPVATETRAPLRQPGSGMRRHTASPPTRRSTRGPGAGNLKPSAGRPGHAREPSAPAFRGRWRRRLCRLQVPRLRRDPGVPIPIVASTTRTGVPRPVAELGGRGNRREADQ
jgi:hypothetical protein